MQSVFTESFDRCSLFSAPVITSKSGYWTVSVIIYHADGMGLMSGYQIWGFISRLHKY